MLPNNEATKEERSSKGEAIHVLPLVTEKTVAEFSALVNEDSKMVKTLLDVFRSEQPEIMEYILYAKKKAAKGMTRNEYQAYVAGAVLVYASIRAQMVKDLEASGILGALGVSFKPTEEKTSS